jgi:hypothetical protein
MNEKGMRTLLQAAFAYERKLLRKLPAWGGVGLRLFTLLIFVTHFGLTLVYVAPINPIKIALQPILHNTIGHYFGQNWSFFAPNPISSNMSLMVRPLNRGEMTLAKNDVLPKVRDTDLGVYPLVPNVAQSGLFRRAPEGSND